MSIRSVHLAFVVASVGLTVIMTGRFLTAFRAEGGAGYLAGALFSGGAGIVLAVYGTRYRVKTRDIDSGHPAGQTGSADR